MRTALVLMLLMLTTTARAANAPSAPDFPRENIEWLDVWLTHTNDHALPRVLLIGDSITRAYYPSVEKLLDGKAYVARLATSKCVGDPLLLAQIALVLSEQKFDVIHFNNGMHGVGVTEEQYRQHFPQFLQAIRAGAPGAKLIWATTTPARKSGQLDVLSPWTDRIRRRNQIAADILADQHIPTDDLFTLVLSHPEYYVKDGVHSNPTGVAAEAQQVAGKISEVLSTLSPKSSTAP